MRRVLVALVVLGACGRVGFDVGADGATASTADAPYIAPMTCSFATQQLPIDSAGSPPNSWITPISTAVTSYGFGIGYIAPDQVPWALTYSGTPGSFTNVVLDTSLTGADQALSMTANGSALVFALEATAGSACSVGAYNETLGSMGSSSYGSLQMATAALAQIDGKIVWVTISSDEIDARFVTPGSTASQPTAVVAANPQEGPSGVTIIPAGDQALITWENTTTGMIEARLFSSSLSPVTAIQQLSTGSEPALTPRAAWSSKYDVYAFTWVQDGNIMVQLASSTLAASGAPIVVAAGAEPKITSDGSGFWIAFHELSTASTVAVAYVGPTGGVVPFAVHGSSNGCGEVDHDVFTFDGVPMLAWDERSGNASSGDNGCGTGSGVNPDPLWIVPMCAL
jgi:hypothetical protein